MVARSRLRASIHPILDPVSASLSIQKILPLSRSSVTGPSFDRVDFHHFPKNSGFDCNSPLAAFFGQNVIE